jgi:ribosomal protein S18 acetylase RimI-like enzyme
MIANIYFCRMNSFSDPNIRIATVDDIPAIRILLNGAYRGKSSTGGWTTEADLIDGDTRTNDSDILDVMGNQGSVFLKYTGEQAEIIGCVNLQQHGDKIYLGMFSVSPKLQGGGIGKKMLRASEEFARELNCASIYMSVISVRNELIDWYKRHGYADTGVRHPFVEDGITGKHLQQLEFMVLEKYLT